MEDWRGRRESRRSSGGSGSLRDGMFWMDAGVVVSSGMREVLERAKVCQRAILSNASSTEPRPSPAAETAIMRFHGCGAMGVCRADLESLPSSLLSSSLSEFQSAGVGGVCGDRNSGCGCG